MLAQAERFRQGRKKVLASSTITLSSRGSIVYTISERGSNISIDPLDHTVSQPRVSSFSCLSRMEPQLLPLTAFLTPTDKRARSLRVPQRFMVLPDHVNVQRLGPKATRADYACREAGCVWKKEAIAAKAARRHAGSAHPGLPCHIFEGVPRQEVLEQYATNHRARCKLWRDQHSEAQPPLRKRTREVSAWDLRRTDYGSGPKGEALTCLCLRLFRRHELAERRRRRRWWRRRRARPTRTTTRRKTITSQVNVALARGPFALGRPVTDMAVAVLLQNGTSFPRTTAMARAGS